MPYDLKSVGGGKFSVVGPHGAKAKHTSKTKAKRQIRLLRGIEHGWRPTGQKESYLEDDPCWAVACTKGKTVRSYVLNADNLAAAEKRAADLFKKETKQDPDDVKGTPYRRPGTPYDNPAGQFRSKDLIDSLI